MAPTGTPTAVIDKVYRDTANVLQAPDMRTRFEQLGMEPVGNPPDEFARAIKEEASRWAKIIADRKLQVE
jgi:tripartite-type tricarboxylate transporter receptor subunit TctC